VPHHLALGAGQISRAENFASRPRVLAETYFCSVVAVRCGGQDSHSEVCPGSGGLRDEREEHDQELNGGLIWVRHYSCLGEQDSEMPSTEGDLRAESHRRVGRRIMSAPYNTRVYTTRVDTRR
jgi:hypothetical protein